MDCVNYKFEWNHPFVDIQNEGTIQAISASPRILGGGAKRHEGTTVRDVINYDPGFGVLGNLG